MTDSTERRRQMVRLSEHKELLQAEKLEARRAEKSSEDRFALLVEAAKDYAIITTDPDGNIVTWNSGAQHLTGWSSSETVGHHLSMLHEQSGEAGRKSAEILSKAAEHGRMEVEGWRSRKDGTKFWADTITTPLREEAGAITGFSEITRDLTERVEHERELLALNASLEAQVKERTSQLEEANKELEAFSYSVSHDLRAPLRAIDGFAKAVMEDYAPKLEPDLVRNLETISRNALKMGQLIDDLLSFSRLNKQPVVLSRVDMNSLVSSTFQEAQKGAPERKVKLTLQRLPDASADKNLLKQVLLNLFSNSIKFSRNQEKPEIKVWSEQGENELIYFVQDNGAGFDMRFVDKLFSPFQRLHRNKDFEGTGIGLALCRRIMARHKGRITATGETNKGTIVTFALPLISEEKQ